MIYSTECHIIKLNHLKKYSCQIQMGINFVIIFKIICISISLYFLFLITLCRHRCSFFSSQSCSYIIRNMQFLSIKAMDALVSPPSSILWTSIQSNKYMKLIIEINSLSNNNSLCNKSSFLNCIRFCLELQASQILLTTSQLYEFFESRRRRCHCRPLKLQALSCEDLKPWGFSEIRHHSREVSVDEVESKTEVELLQIRPT